jgi:hypothetical protein
MAIAFPNPSRRYDSTRNCVRFSGYDGALERPFFVEEDAIRRLDATALGGESGLLDGFDRHRAHICEVAGKVYGKRREGSYTLTAADFQ